jgi:hypothetical protein
MNFFYKDDLNPKVVESQSSKGWDRLTILCKQSLKNDILFGISTLVLKGKRLDKEVLLESKMEENATIFRQLSDKTNEDEINQLDYFVPGSRASKLMEKSLKKQPYISEKNLPKEKENRPRFVSSARQLLRQEDDLSTKPTTGCLMLGQTRGQTKSDLSEHWKQCPKTN